MAQSRRTPHNYQRTDRVSALVRSIVADQLERLGDASDGAFDGVVITGVDVDRELSAATVYYDLRERELADEVALAFEEHHSRMQRAVGQQTRLRRTPALRFRLDESLAAADRISALLAELDLDESN